MRSQDLRSSADVTFYKTCAALVSVPEEGLVSSHVAPSTSFNKHNHLMRAIVSMIGGGGLAIRNPSALSCKIGNERRVSTGQLHEKLSWVLQVSW